MSHSKLYDIIVSNIDNLLETAKKLALKPSKQNCYFLFRNSACALIRQHMLHDYSDRDLRYIWEILAPNVKHQFKLISIAIEHTPTLKTKTRVPIRRRVKRQSQASFIVQRTTQRTLNFDSRYPQIVFLEDPAIPRLEQNALFSRYTNANDINSA